MNDQEMTRLKKIKTRVRRHLDGVDGVVGVGIGVGGIRVLVRDTASIDRVLAALQPGEVVTTTVTIEVVGEIKAGEGT